MISLTPAQWNVLRFIAGFQLMKGFSPTCQEIADGMGYGSKSTAFRTMLALEERGAIKSRKLPNDRRRSDIEIVTPIPVSIPRAPDGAPLHVVHVGALLKEHWA